MTYTKQLVRSCSVGEQEQLEGKVVNRIKPLLEQLGRKPSGLQMCLEWESDKVVCSAAVRENFGKFSHSMERRLLGQADSKSGSPSVFMAVGNVQDLELSKNNETLTEELKIFGKRMKTVDKLDLVQPHDQVYCEASLIVDCGDQHVSKNLQFQQPCEDEKNNNPKESMSRDDQENFIDSEYGSSDESCSLENPEYESSDDSEVFYSDNWSEGDDVKGDPNLAQLSVIPPIGTEDVLSTGIALNTNQHGDLTISPDLEGGISISSNGHGDMLIASSTNNELDIFVSHLGDLVISNSCVKDIAITANTSSNEIHPEQQIISSTGAKGPVVTIVPMYAEGTRDQLMGDRYGESFFLLLH